MATPFSAIEPDTFRPLKRAEYDRLVELGVFEGERIELVQGVLVQMSPNHPPHASMVQKLTKILTPPLHARFAIRVQLPIAASDDSELEPDIAICELGAYDDEHPTTAALIIEVADSSLRADRRKATIYARAGIDEYWIVNVRARTVEIYTAPDGDRYATTRTAHEAETVSPACAPEVAFVVRDMLPAQP